MAIASLCFIAISLAASVQAQNAGCIFNNTMCSCLFGTADGDCWDPIDSNPGFCERRVCDAGWTCDCDGDYLCHRGPTTVSLVPDVTNNPAACTTAEEIRINMAGCKLGYFHPSISPTGFAAGACQNWVWWLNGDPPQNIFTNSDNQANGDLNALTQWNDLPLKPGDVLAFRWRDEWEECYMQFTELSVNGTVINTMDPTATRHVFSEDFVTGWPEVGFDDSSWSAPVLPLNTDSFNNEPKVQNLFTSFLPAFSNISFVHPQLVSVAG